MSKTPWTPGPWRVENNRFEHWGLREVVGPSLQVNGFVIATDVDAKRAARIEADVRPIAAAPELAEALEPFAKVRIERANPNAEANSPWPDDRVLVGYDGFELTVGMIRAVRAALAKARGETP